MRTTIIIPLLLTAAAAFGSDEYATFHFPVDSSIVTIVKFDENGESTDIKISTQEWEVALNRLCWKSVLTTATGSGETALPEAQRFCDELNNKYEGEIRHWIEEVKHEPTTFAGTVSDITTSTLVPVGWGQPTLEGVAELKKEIVRLEGERRKFFWGMVAALVVAFIMTMIYFESVSQGNKTCGGEEEA